MTRAPGLVVRVVVLLGLAWFYLVAATEHARVVNDFKARGDQSRYLGDAEQVYRNWHGQNPPGLIGERNRMPLYAGFQSLFYDTSMSDPEYFEVAKVWNIRLSLLLLAVLWVIFSWHLPPLLATNLIVIVAFGYFVFKAGYVQAELLFYFLFFATFLTFCYLLTRRGLKSSLLLAALGGTVAALAHLTKAAVLPFVAIFLAVYGTRDAVLLVRRWRNEPLAALTVFGGRALAAVLMVACFLGVLYPYISNSKRFFRQYFYNVNTTFYIWNDNWPQALTRVHQYGDGVGWPTAPASQLPSMRKYWRTHTVAQIIDRVGNGFLDMVRRSYSTFWYMKYVAVYLAFAVALIAANRRAFTRLIREHAALFAFMLLYGVIYLVSTAFYAPTSDTGTTRFLLAHVAPLLFVLSYFFASSPFRDTRWNVAGVTATPTHFHLLVLVTMGLDLAFTLWPRLMTTYGGF